MGNENMRHYSRRNSWRPFVDDDECRLCHKLIDSTWLFFISLISQLRSTKFHPVLYWTVILATSTAGTTMSDFMDRTLELGYANGSMILITILIIVLSLWHFSEKSLSVNNIQTTKA